MASIRIPLLASLLALAMLAVALVPSTDEGLLAGAILDAGHVPLYGVFAIFLLRLLRIAPGLVGRGWPLHYLLAFLGVVFFGLLTEFMQVFVMRDAGLMDFVRDLLGGGGALLAHLAFDRRRVSRAIAALLMLVAIGLWGTGLAQLAWISRDLVARDRAFPILCAFDEVWEERFVHVHGGGLSRVPPRADWPVAGLVGRVEFEVGGFPGLQIREPVADWAAYGTLRLGIMASEPLRLSLRVHDSWHDESYGDRFNRDLVIGPGVNEIEITLDEIAAAPREREMDLTRIAGLALFADNPDREIVFFVDKIELAVE